MTDDHFKTISRKLDLLVRLAAHSLVADKKQREQIMLLSNASFQPKEIAEILGTTPNTVRVALSAMRKREKRG
ncbi:MAG: hypothetical protein V3U24_09860 [Candidatus Neomarinimicrobiota bacterium]